MYWHLQNVIKYQFGFKFMQMIIYCILFRKHEIVTFLVAPENFIRIMFHHLQHLFMSITVHVVVSKSNVLSKTRYF